MENTLISVIVPVYNCEQYLAACLDSILTQSHHNIEVIVVNDGSTDYSLKIAETYAEKDDRITVYSFENAGLAEARNRGLNVATGEYIVFVDSDDLLLPKALEVLLNILLKYSLDILEGKIIYGRSTRTIKYHSEITTEILTPEKAIGDILYQHKLLPSSCGKIFKQSLFNDERYRKGIIYEDLDIIIRLIEKTNKIGYTNFPVYFYRDNETSITHTWRQNRLDVLRITENIENFIAEKYPALMPAAKDRRLSANFNMFALCSLHGDKENAEKCWNHIKANRKPSLFNPHVRLKNKAGILLSYLGKNIFSFTSRRFYK